MTLTQKVTLCGGPSPLTDLITLHPDDAERLVQDRLVSLRARMALTVAGLVELAKALV